MRVSQNNCYQIVYGDELFIHFTDFFILTPEKLNIEHKQAKIGNLKNLPPLLYEKKHKF